MVIGLTSEARRASPRVGPGCRKLEHQRLRALLARFGIYRPAPVCWHLANLRTNTRRETRQVSPKHSAKITGFRSLFREREDAYCLCSCCSCQFGRFRFGRARPRRPDFRPSLNGGRRWSEVLCPARDCGNPAKVRRSGILNQAICCPWHQDCDLPLARPVFQWVNAGSPDRPAFGRTSKNTWAALDGTVPLTFFSEWPDLKDFNNGQLMDQ